jgi:HAD superfamily hydrolase (TIGR01509 family)
MKALLVDLYDTLIWMDFPALGRWLATRLDVDGQTLMRAFETTSMARGRGRYGSIRGDLGALIAAARGATDDLFIATLETELLAFVEQNSHLYDDVRPVLRALRNSGTRVAIVSNCDHTTKPLLDKLELEREVNATVLSFEVDSLKPEAAIFEHALARIGVNAEEAVFVDDQDRFLDGARALGIRTLRIARGTPHPMLSNAEAHQVIADLTSLIEFCSTVPDSSLPEVPAQRRLTVV